jgi:hypothetical protein
VISTPSAAVATNSAHPVTIDAVISIVASVSSEYVTLIFPVVGNAAPTVTDVGNDVISIDSTVLTGVVSSFTVILYSIVLPL